MLTVMIGFDQMAAFGEKKIRMLKRRAEMWDSAAEVSIGFLIFHAFRSQILLHSCILFASDISPYGSHHSVCS